jgi:hypothetical protein
MFPFRRFVLRRRAVVNLVDGTAIEGLLYRKSGPLLVLKDAHHLEPGKDPLAIDGDTVIERRQVLFIQAL